MEGIKPNLKFFISKLPTLVTVRLDAGNYVLWKQQITNVFQAHGFFGYLDGSTPCPDQYVVDAETLAPNHLHAEWNLTDRHSVTCLQSTISIGVLPALIGVHTCHEIWEVLEQRYASVSVTHAHQLRTELARTRMEGGTIAGYLNKLKILDDKLAMIEAPMTASEFIHQALVDLPRKYAAFRTTVR